MSRVLTTQETLERLIASSKPAEPAVDLSSIDARLTSLEDKFRELDSLVSRIIRRELPHVADAIDGIQQERRDDVATLRQYVDEQITNQEQPTQSVADKGKSGRSNSRKKKTRKRKEATSSNETSSDSKTDSSESSSDDSDEEVTDAILTRGPKYPGLSTLRTGSSLHKSVLDYRYYRLTNRKVRRSAKETYKVKDHLKRLELTMKRRTFDGSDPITVLTFLARLTRECNILGMSEAQAYIALPYFLTGMALTQYEAARNVVTSRQGGVSSWPEAVQFLLQTFATETAVSQSMMDLRNIRQKHNEDENSYGTRLSVASSRCGNVHKQSDLAMFFIDGLDSTIRSIVSRKYADTRHMSFIALAKFAQEEGTAVRARERPSRKNTGDRLATLGDNDVKPDSERGDLNLLGWKDNPTPRNVRASDDRLSITTPGDNRQTPPRYRPPPQRDQTPPNTRLICHDCYERGHVTRQCTTPINRFDQVIANYESLNEDERKRVPIIGYKRAKAASNATLEETTATVNIDEAGETATLDEEGEEEQTHLN